MSIKCNQQKHDLWFWARSVVYLSDSGYNLIKQKEEKEMIIIEETFAKSL